MAPSKRNHHKFPHFRRWALNTLLPMEALRFESVQPTLGLAPHIRIEIFQFRRNDFQSLR